ncbi:MAG: glycine cleavage system aminomethyltransferase GcvT [Pirellulales bacterium]|nr:glycine cleavage system aminomethyltransferase GcvT [Pirellulales bacterium]
MTSTFYTPLHTPLYDWHVAHGGRMVEFAGWAMPVQYTSIIEEHLATRSAVGLCDITHMSHFRFEGPGAGDFLGHLLTRRIGDLNPGHLRYSLVTNDEGGILDDVLVGHFHDAKAQPFYVVVANGVNRLKLVDWINAHLPKELAQFPGQEVAYWDVTRLWAMIAIQGPRSLDLLRPFVDADLDEMPYYTGAEIRILHPAGRRQGGIISRTGYTAEDGFELILGVGVAPGVWQALLEAARPLGGLPTGIGARDTLRLEAGMPLYGHELTEQVNPFQAGLGFACELHNLDYPGRDALLRLKQQPLESQRIGLEMAGRRVPRQGCMILAESRPIGQVTSGSYSPTFEKPVAMGYVTPEYAQPGTRVDVDIRGRLEPANVVKLPFYRRNPKGKHK